MKDEDIKLIVENEKEWRLHILKMQFQQTSEISDIKKEVGNLKVKVAGFASFFGALAAYLKAKFGA